MVKMIFDAQRDLKDGRSVWLHRKMFTWAIVIGPTGQDWYSDHWCFETREKAEEQFKEWNPLETPEPSGWVRNPRTGRRRPDGDASREYINW